jgi:hypothetical protein
MPLARTLGWTLFAFLFFFQLSNVLKYAVDVPNWDEWETLVPGVLRSPLSLTWLIQQHNEHRIVPTKLLTWSRYLLDGWDVRVQQIINFFIYGGLVGSFFFLKKKIAPTLPGWILALFLGYCFSMVPHENHSWGFQSQFHFTILFFVLACGVLFDERRSLIQLTAGSILLAFSMFSFSSGIPSSLAISGVFAMSMVCRAASAPSQSKTLFFKTGWVVFLIGAAVLFWFHGFQRPGGHPSLILPNQLQFWAVMLNMISLGFGFETQSTALGAFCLAVVMAPIAAWFWRDRARLTSSHWMLLGVFGGLFVAVLTITIGRAGFGAGAAKTSRYSEFPIFLIPLAVMSWWNLLADAPSLRTRIIAALWAFCFVGFADDWNGKTAYSFDFDKRMAGIGCVTEYYLHGGAADCPTIYPHPIPNRLEEAKRLNISFYRAIESRVHPPQAR